MEEQYAFPYPGAPYDPRTGGPYPYQPPIYPQPMPSYPPQMAPKTASTQAASVNPPLKTGEGIRPLSKQERDEATRAAAIADFSFTGYQVVRREFFSHKFDPSITIRNNAITFNTACISSMEGVVYVQIMINPERLKLAIRPCKAGDRDAIRWCVAKEDKRKSRQISCEKFTEKLYAMMGWETLYRYKMQGFTTDYQGQPIYVFDLSSSESFIPTVGKADGPDAKQKKKYEPTFPTDTFGMTVNEHDQSQSIDLSEGFEGISMEPDPKKTEPIVEQIPMEIIDQETGEVTRV